MSRQKQRDTGPEIAVRRLVYKLGHRYRVRNSDLPGSPDLANRSRSWAVFVHGCYWHHHPGCSRATIPKSNKDFWMAKFQTNRERDSQAIKKLEALGFKVLVVWECELVETEGLKNKILEFMV